MVGAVFGNGYLDKCNKIHDRILLHIKPFGRGVYIINMGDYDQEKNIKNEINILFANLMELKLIIRSRDLQQEQDNSRYTTILPKVEKYDLNTHYCLAFEVAKKLIGSVLIPLNQPEDLEYSLNQAIAHYQSS